MKHARGVHVPYVDFEVLGYAAPIEYFELCGEALVNLLMKVLARLDDLIQVVQESLHLLVCGAEHRNSVYFEDVLAASSAYFCVRG